MRPQRITVTRIDRTSQCMHRDRDTAKTLDGLKVAFPNVAKACGACHELSAAPVRSRQAVVPALRRFGPVRGNRVVSGVAAVCLLGPRPAAPEQTLPPLVPWPPGG